MILDHKTLEKINLEMPLSKDMYSRIFVDLLCDKIKNIELSNYQRNVYLNSKIQLDQLKALRGLLSLFI